MIIILFFKNKTDLKRSPTRIQFNIGVIKKPKNENDGNTNSTIPTASNIFQQRQMLPVYQHRKRLMEEVNLRSTVIIIGETGSGKTTQIPQFIYNLTLMRDRCIAVTQPRRVAAVTIAKRVAIEMCTKLGSLVGYAVRFEDVTCKATKIKYLTDGILLREAMSDENLMAYNVVILDEAHERTVHTDILFGIVKKAQATRAANKLPPLKVIVMSATMDVDHFSRYFNNAVVLYVEGRQFTVNMNHACQPQEDYAFSCLVTIFQIHKEAPPNHDILVFLTGKEEIEAMAANIRLISKDPQCQGPQLRVYPLYASLSTSKQVDVFRPTPPGARKVILSTNIAETSVTVSGVKYVIDSGMVKTRTYHPGTCLDILKVQRISQAQAWQRAGRAGREADGYCYRTYTLNEFNNMEKNTVPEILRCNLASVVLQMLVIGINPLTHDFLDKPPKELVLEALHQLQQLGAIDGVESMKLTLLGKQMSLFPLDPRYSKIILSAKEYRCLDEILSIVAVLSSESLFLCPPDKKSAANAARAKFLSSVGDHVTLLKIYRCYSSVKIKKQWCYENFLNARNLEYAMNVRSQLRELCERLDMPPSSCGQDMDSVRKCLLTGLFQNLAELQRDKQYVTVGTRQAVHIHPSSALFGSLPHCVLFTELIQTGRCYMRDLSVVDPNWLEDVNPAYAKLHPLRKLD